MIQIEAVELLNRASKDQSSLLYTLYVRSKSSLFLNRQEHA